MRFVALLALAAFACACAPVAPYHRAYLARDDMVLYANPGTMKALEKTFSAKEAAQGGGSVGGGGCGCN